MNKKNVEIKQVLPTLSFHRRNHQKEVKEKCSLYGSDATGLPQEAHLHDMSHVPVMILCIKQNITCSGPINTCKYSVCRRELTNYTGSKQIGTAWHNFLHLLLEYRLQTCLLMLNSHYTILISSLTRILQVSHLSGIYVFLISLAFFFPT